MKNYLDGGEAILEGLRALNVDYIMSSPGSDWGSLWEALARQDMNKTPGPKYLSCAHETLAANLALGYTFVTGRMQAVVLHAGVGLLQGSIGIDAMNRLGLPMILFSSEANTFGEKPGFDPGHQWISSLAVVGGPQRIIDPLVKWSGAVVTPDTMYETIVRSGLLAQQNPAGVVYLNTPIETMLSQWTPPAMPHKTAPVAKPVAPDSEIDRVAKLLLSAETPVIVTDGAGRSVEGYEALRELAELYAIPVVEPGYTEVANFRKDHPLHQGNTMQPFLDVADLVLVVRARVPWYPPYKRPTKAKIVTIDEQPVRGAMVYQNVPADIVVEGDVVHTLKRLAAAVRDGKPKADKVATRLERCTAAHNKMKEGYRQAEANPQNKKGLNAAWVCKTMNETLPNDTVYVDETITYRGYTVKHLNWGGPQTHFRVGGGLGQGFGTALGVKLALKNKLVTWVAGDGGFLYNPLVQSLALSKHANLPILITVFNNTGYRSMASEHRNFYPDGAAAESNNWYGNPITDFDYAKLVEPFGGFGRKVDKPAELVPALKDGMAAVKDGKTAILNITVD
jgi:acetolactate synthase I/II/III large subunit